ncbi:MULTISPECIES: SMI1/KNR4 family protein [Pseudomonas]|uniref:SMI1/KNR4 family protein n=1 Tax=Serpens gallinarum TaxID=2763075 RepID=A0ABR8TMI2_9PSED|nr:SMI1/KNR4 family protein [Pseudomonas sp.]MBD7976725.1 SMI1/KNR4 family protein [Serpens gallinarum]MBF0676833.1 SMI1/KNR4 family protein [Pseudomonas sp.]
MEDVIDQLREVNETVPVPLELPEEETLVEIQEQILIHLPYELREFLLKVSDVVYGRLEPVTASDPHSHTYLPEVAATAWDIGVPRELVPLCQDGRDYYVVDAEGEVFLWLEETGELDDESWESVWHWVRDVWLES